MPVTTPPTTVAAAVALDPSPVIVTVGVDV